MSRLPVGHLDTETCKVLDIVHDSVVDGEGLRTVIFFAGCPHRCDGCHNPYSWNMDNGSDMTVDELFEETFNPLTNITFSGGEPFAQARQIKPLAKRLKASGRHIWIYSGYTLEQLRERNDPDEIELLASCDVLVDGPFILSERDLTLSFRGSRNQRIHFLT
ncbi:anaerobic ribonucleoside-triphosphate reductase activating protein [Marinicrinis sediminis]|uniref:Anaerobic ribonucleoside-triphosphate reductase-activating protein n=1 Tax=Marinicrinis sediminis TaxID=1652465 RepID=A0ABW5R940_9BACL